MLIDRLWELQELQLDYQKKDRLLQESDLASSMNRKIRETDEQLGALREQLDTVRIEETRINTKLDDISSKIHEAGSKLGGKEALSEEKVQKLEEKMRKLSVEKEKVEEAQGRNFHDRQDMDDQIRAQEMLLEKLRKELATIPHLDGPARTALKKSLPGLRTDIERRKGELPLKSRLIFESLSQKFSGAPIARATGSVCDYCHVKLSLKTLSRLRDPAVSHVDAEELIRCEICGKILYAGSNDRE
jgi:predicted  nucleic acid-binding Zn-ribbon protein